MSKELGQEEFGVCKLGSPSTNSPPLASLGMMFIFSPLLYVMSIAAFPDMEDYSSRFI